MIASYYGYTDFSNEAHKIDQKMGHKTSQKICYTSHSVDDLDLEQDQAHKPAMARSGQACVGWSMWLYLGPHRPALGKVGVGQGAETGSVFVG